MMNQQIFKIYFIPLLMAFAISLILVPFVKLLGLKLKAYAQINERTVHTKQIVRIGGLAVYCSFIVVTVLNFDFQNHTINAILISSTIIFFTGLYDDLKNMKAKNKFLLQLIASCFVVIYGQIRLDNINLGLIKMDVSAISILVSIFWILAVTNAINLIDGLDGLSSGISIITLVVVSIISYFMFEVGLTVISCIMIGAILGFLPYNFYPAKLFVGDCGALLYGFFIACLSILNYKTSTFLTLGIPMIILFIPLADTTIAILRRKLAGQKISDADKKHIHHILMFKLGFSHRTTVLIIYCVSILFGLSAITLYINRLIGLIMFAMLCSIMWIFIELTGIISPKFHPIIGLIRKYFKHPIKKENAFFEANKIEHND